MLMLFRMLKRRIKPEQEKAIYPEGYLMAQNKARTPRQRYVLNSRLTLGRKKQMFL